MAAIDELIEQIENPVLREQITDAINVFLHASIMEGGFPFQSKKPRYNRETLMAMKEARDIMEGKVEAKIYNSLNDLLAEMDAEDASA